MKDSRDLLDTLFQEMVVYYGGDPERIQHFIKVHSFSAYIGRKENISEEEQIILEAAAYVHDIGIKAAERIYGSSDGKYQEELGPELAEDMLGKYGFSENEICLHCLLQIYPQDPAPCASFRAQNRRKQTFRYLSHSESQEHPYPETENLLLLFRRQETLLQQKKFEICNTF